MRDKCSFLWIWDDGEIWKVRNGRSCAKFPADVDAKFCVLTMLRPEKDGERIELAGIGSASRCGTISSDRSSCGRWLYEVPE